MFLTESYTISQHFLVRLHSFLLLVSQTRAEWDLFFSLPDPMPNLVTGKAGSAWEAWAAQRFRHTRDKFFWNPRNVVSRFLVSIWVGKSSNDGLVSFNVAFSSTLSGRPLNWLKSLSLPLANGVHAASSPCW